MAGLVFFLVVCGHLECPYGNTYKQLEKLHLLWIKHKHVCTWVYARVKLSYIATSIIGLSAGKLFKLISCQCLIFLVSLPSCMEWFNVYVKSLRQLAIKILCVRLCCICSEFDFISRAKAFFLGTLFLQVMSMSAGMPL